MGGPDRLGLGMYMVREAVQQDMGAAFLRLARMGYRGIEFYGEPSSFSPEQICKSLADSGLTLTGWHIDWGLLQEESFGRTVRFLQRVGCPTAVIPCLGGRWNVGHDSRQECRDRWLYYLDWLNRTGERLAAEGLQLGYHNHDHEFSLRYEGQSVFDLLFENLSPDILMEFDCGNCIEGGCDPLAVLEKYRDKRILLHGKPYSRKLGFEVELGDAQDDNDWNALLRRYQDRFEWILIESENGTLPELENAQRCIGRLRAYMTEEKKGRERDEGIGNL